ncbi:hypothetical protein MKW98_002266 [Papaver atlanticum]|uniref:RNase H type-1 domain-containing protein n=1 Tax=Papaver atlanticum TaxID=357466 RepID=A0AAD4RVA2_9MAGN|nr:hypothetical protein MKW98_002266 [Papaver atlanticum]
MFSNYYHAMNHTSTEEIITTHASIQANPKWCPPPTNVTKLNVDGSTKDNDSVVGIIARNDRGGFMGGQAIYFHESSPLCAEACGFVHMLNYAKEKGMDNCIVEGDAQVIINLINSSAQDPP